MGGFIPLCTILLLAVERGQAVGRDSSIVYPRLLESRTAGRGKTLKLNDDLVLNLEPSSVFSEVFLVQTFHDGKPHESYHHAKEFEDDLYHDADKMASVMVTEMDNLRVEGVVGPGLRIRPVEGMERSSEGDVAHLLYSVQEKTTSGREDYGSVLSAAGMSARKIETAVPTLSEREYSPEGTVYPEVHVVVQCDHAKAFNFNVTLIIQYFAVFLNVVNLRYRSVKHPNVQIRIVGLTVNRHRSDEPYVKTDGRLPRLMKTIETINAFMEYFRKTVAFSKADIVFLVTALNMILGEGQTRTVGISGYAFCGAACTYHKFGECEDTPLSYDGTHLFAHELAHTLGCVHDEDPPDLWVGPGHPGAQQCPWQDGYIMSYVLNDTNQFKFSNCCVEEMRYVFGLKSRQCLHQKNADYKILRTKGLPGLYVNGSSFCRFMHGRRYPKAYPDPNYDRSGCKLQCIAPRPKRAFSDKVFTHYAIDGSRCDRRNSSLVCLNGKCRPKQLWSKYITKLLKSTKE